MGGYGEPVFISFPLLIFSSSSRIQIDGRRGYVNKGHVQETRVHQKNLEFKVPTEFYKGEPEKEAAVDDEEPKAEVQSSEVNEKEKDAAVDVEEPEAEVQSSEVNEEAVNQLPSQEGDSNQESIPIETDARIEATEPSTDQEFETVDPKLPNSAEVNIEY